MLQQIRRTEIVAQPPQQLHIDAGILRTQIARVQIPEQRREHRHVHRRRAQLQTDARPEARTAGQQVAKVRAARRQQRPMHREHAAAEHQITIGGVLEVVQRRQVLLECGGRRPGELRLHGQILEGGQRLVLLEQRRHLDRRPVGQELAEHASVVARLARPPPADELFAQRREAGDLFATRFAHNVRRTAAGSAGAVGRQRTTAGIVRRCCRTAAAIVAGSCGATADV